MEKRFFQTNGRCLSYVYHDGASKETLVFIHGAGSNLSQFNQQVEYFKTLFNVLNITLHGHDETLKAQVFTYDAFALKHLADDVLNLIKTLEIKAFHLIGNSAGGLVGLELIKSNQLIPKSLITFGTAPKLMVPKLLVKLVTKIDVYMLKKKPQKYLRFAAKACSKDEDVIKEITHIMMRSKHAAPFIRSQIGRYDYLDVIKTLPCQYLILKGPYDKSINKALKKYENSWQNNTNITVQIIEDSGHFMNLDQPSMFNKAISNFIQSV